MTFTRIKKFLLLKEERGSLNVFTKIPSLSLNNNKNLKTQRLCTSQKKLSRTISNHKAQGSITITKFRTIKIQLAKIGRRRRPNEISTCSRNRVEIILERGRRSGRRVAYITVHSRPLSKKTINLETSTTRPNAFITKNHTISIEPDKPPYKIKLFDYFQRELKMTTMYYVALIITFTKIENVAFILRRIKYVINWLKFIMLWECVSQSQRTY